MSDKKGRDEYRQRAELIEGQKKEKAKLFWAVAIDMDEHLMLGIRI